MKKVIEIVITLVVLGTIGYGGYYIYERATAPAERVYRTAPVKRGGIIANINATGTIEPEEVVDIGAQVAGRINSFGMDKAGKPIDYGSVVEAETILAQIDASLYESDLAQARAQFDVDTAGVAKAQADLETAKAKLDQTKSDHEQLKAKLEQVQSDQHQFDARVDQAKSDLAQSQAKFEQAQRDWTRAQRLGPSDALSQESFDAFKGVFEAAQGAVNSNKAMIAQADANVISQRAVIAQAKANIESQKAVVAQATAAIAASAAMINQAKGTVAHDVASVARAQKNVDYCTIKSPVKGVIIDRRVNIGQTVVSSLNAPSLFLLAKDLTRVQVWASMNEADIGSIKPGQPVTFTVEAFAKTFKGSVRKIRLNATSTQNVTTYTIEVETDNSSGILYPYMTANTSFEVARKDDVMMVPNSALRFMPKPDEIAPDVPPEEEKPAHGRGSHADGALPPADTGDKPMSDTKEVTHAAKPRKTRSKVWIKDGQFVRPIKVEVGITDGTNTEIISGEVKEEMLVVVGKQATSSADAANPTNPFTPQLGRKNTSGGGGAAPSGPPPGR